MSSSDEHSRGRESNCTPLSPAAFARLAALVLTICSERGNPTLALLTTSGSSLYDVLRRRRRQLEVGGGRSGVGAYFSLPRVAAIGADCFLALSHLHRLGLTHTRTSSWRSVPGAFQEPSRNLLIGTRTSSWRTCSSPRPPSRRDAAAEMAETRRGTAEGWPRDGQGWPSDGGGMAGRWPRCGRGVAEGSRCGRETAERRPRGGREAAERCPREREKAAASSAEPARR